MASIKKKNGRGGARMGSGPKPKPLAQRRRNRVVLNLTDQELRQLKAAVGSEQVGSFIRRIIFRYLARRRK